MGGWVGVGGERCRGGWAGRCVNFTPALPPLTGLEHTQLPDEEQTPFMKQSSVVKQAMEDAQKVASSNTVPQVQHCPHCPPGCCLCSI